MRRGATIRVVFLTSVAGRAYICCAFERVSQRLDCVSCLCSHSLLHYFNLLVADTMLRYTGRRLAQTEILFLKWYLARAATFRVPEFISWASQEIRTEDAGQKWIQRGVCCLCSREE